MGLYLPGTNSKSTRTILIKNFTKEEYPKVVELLTDSDYIKKFNLTNEECRLLKENKNEAAFDIIKLVQYIFVESLDDIVSYTVKNHVYFPTMKVIELDNVNRNEIMKNFGILNVGNHSNDCHGCKTCVFNFKS